MKNTFIARMTVALAAVFLTVALLPEDAEARRLGGARSFGKQSPNVNRQQVAPPSKPAEATGQQAGNTAQAPGASRNRWMGPLAGLAAGLGIAALLSHLGLGGAFAEMLGSMLLIGLLVMAGLFVWRMLRRSSESPTPARPMEPAFATAAPQPQPSGSGRNVSVLGTPLPDLGSAPQAVGASWSVPTDFDTAGFLRVAKVQFIRMQAASDENNLADIREFTTPEAFAEIKLQLDEDASADHKTDVVNLDAVLLGIETGPTEYLASVRFSGLLREDKQADATPFEEVWNLSKPINGKSGWLLAGIQQLQ
jgi:predicted lipid-binding transport protein (Tim44 family)